MTRTRRRPAANRFRYMKLFFVWYWGEVEPHYGIQSGIYAVRAANPEDCAQFLLHTREKPEPGQDTTDMLKRIREMVARATSVKLLGRFKLEAMVAHLENDFLDFN